MRGSDDVFTHNGENIKQRMRKYWNKVVVDDLSCLDKGFMAELQHEQNLIEEVVYKYGFKENNEQQRAFCIVANHASGKNHLSLGHPR
jgi:hypothetical protein